VAPIVRFTMQDREAMVSPDGRRLVFNTDRGGFFEIHTANLDGTNQTALTSMGPTAMGSPRWSPDGTTVVFDRYENGHSLIYTIGGEGGKPHRITEGYRDIRPSFSHDGKWIYFSSNRSGPLEIWKVPAGGGVATQLTHNSGFEPFESPDGKLVYYLTEQGLWSVPVDGGEAKQVLAEPLKFLFAPAGHNIYFGRRNPRGIWVLNTKTGQKFEYVRFPQEGVGFEVSTSSLSVSPDERTILYTQIDRQESDLMLVENFR